eukprot:19183_1
MYPPVFLKSFRQKQSILIMTTLQKPSRWINLAFRSDDIARFCPQQIVTISAHEFIIYGFCEEHWQCKLLKYNIDTNEMNEWTHSIEMTEWVNATEKNAIYNIAFNEKEQTLYIRNNSPAIVSFNMETNNTNTYSFHVPHGKYFLFINNCFHMINKHDRHWIGSIQNKSLNTLHDTIG